MVNYVYFKTGENISHAYSQTPRDGPNWFPIDDFDWSRFYVERNIATGTFELFGRQTTKSDSQFQASSDVQALQLQTESSYNDLESRVYRIEEIERNLTE